MRSNMLNAIFKTAAIAGVLLSAGVSSAATVSLRAEAGNNTDAAGAPVWRFVCEPVVEGTCDQTTEGAPVITVSSSDTLSITVSNALPVPVSLFIPGQTSDTLAPVMVGGRVQSFDAEAPAGGSQSYSYTTLKPGTYLMQSGTQPSLQVPMGLFGTLIVTDPGYPTAANETVLQFSEIDPLQNERVDAAAAAGALATPACVKLSEYLTEMTPGYPCTIDYNPQYLLVNGQSTPDLGAFATGGEVHVRFLNAGQRTHTPAFTNVEMSIFAEDGNVYPGLPLRQAEALLPAGKTLDAIVTLPATDVTVALNDRSPAFDDLNRPAGGASGSIVSGNGTTTVVTPNENTAEFSVPEDSVDFLWDPPGGNGLRIVGSAVHGSVETYDNAGTLNFSYTPFPDFSGTDTFTYYQPGNETTWYVTVHVTPVNDLPVGTADAYSNTFAAGITVDPPGVLANDVDVDGDALTATLVGSPADVVFNADGSFSYSGTTGTMFQYTIDDGSGTPSDPVDVTLTINQANGLALNVQDPAGNVVTEYRWLIQELAMYEVNPSAPAPLLEQQSLNFHKSYMPVIAQGCYGCLADINVDPQDDFPGPGDFDYDGDGVQDMAGMINLADLYLDPTKNYYVSVLPNDAGTGVGHSIGGAQINAIGTGGTYGTVDVFVNQQEIPTAQVSVLVFNDNAPTNGVPDGTEVGMGGFQLVLEEAGGRYGASGGAVSQDAYGNPIENSLDCAPAAAPGIVLSCPDGSILVKDLPPAKYGIIVVPPADAQQWIQTSTIEGTKVIDAWVKANEPQFFAEFGIPAPHVFVGFVDPGTTVFPAGSAGANSITGNVTLLHDPRPPAAPGTSDSGSYDGLAHTSAWIGLNSVAGDGPNYATVQAAGDGSFTIPNVPDGDYQVVVWDTYLDQVIAFQAVTVVGGDVAMGNVPVNNWFTRVEHNVFLDANGNAIFDEGEIGLPEQNVNLRWRDGTINQAFPTDSEGFVPFDETFPFFHWQVFEVDYARFKPTGMTTIVDAGGTVDSAPGGSGGPGGFLLNSEYRDGTSTVRTELGSTVLLEAFQGFPGQTSIIDWGKVPYQAGENGGISGIVSYGSTRGEFDPRLTVMDPWEPGIPRVTVNLYREVELVGGEISLALVQSVQTDSWDDSLPEGCLGEVAAGANDPFVDGTLAGDDTRCYDGWRAWNQVRPGVFDGGYAFNDIPPGNYVVEVIPPDGYEIIKEEDMNVGFGDSFRDPTVPSSFAATSVVLPGGGLVYTIPDWAMVAVVQSLEPGLAQPPCVGPERLVPPELSLFPGEAAPFAYAYRPLCNRKAVVLSDQGQAAADFHLFTSTPVAAQFTGLITDDIAAETNPANPGFGEKASPAYLPFSIRDFTGREVYHGYSDAFGHYNGVLPSTFTANMPIPSGYSPAMMNACLNDPGDADPLNPLVNTNYSKVCYTSQFMPGTTTYLDTPVLPQAAFAAGFNGPDCEAPNGTPVIASVGNDTDETFGPLVGPGETIIIQSAGPAAIVPNPAYEGPLAPAPFNAPTITRDLGFGAGGGPNRGIVEIVESNGIRHQLVTLGGGNGWTPNTIRAIAPATPMTGQLVVTRGDGSNAGSQSVNAVTITVSNEAATRVASGESIQAAINAAAPGALILVAPGVYNELVVMDKPVRLQGSGATTIINGTPSPAEKLADWNLLIESLVTNNDVSLLPGQPTAGTPFAPGLLGTEQGPVITVLAKGGPGSGCFGGNPGDGCFQIAGGVRPASRIDGFTVTGGGSGGGIFVNGYAHGLEISNNNVTSNTGALNGGIRVGHPYLGYVAADAPFQFNNNINIHNNAVTRNGATGEQAAGGGIAIETGTNAYTVASNFVCGNFSQADGGGIAHLGLSRNGTIENNQILFNQSFNPSLTYSGGGLFIAGEQPAPPTVPGVEPELLSLGTGNVSVIANRIQGNQAGSGHGGGVRVERVNGAEVPDAAGENQLYLLLMDNNIIVDNVAGWSGGGVSFLDAARVIMRNNTIANNDSTATVGSLLATPSDISDPQPAGVASQQHSLVLAAALDLNANVAAQSYSYPNMVNNIVWHNRAFYFDGLNATHLQPDVGPVAAIGDCGTGADYWDIGVIGGAGDIQPRRSLLSSLTDAHGGDFSGNLNEAGDPLFVSGYCNGARTLSTPGPMLATASLGEAGNFVDVRYGPLTQAWSAADGTAAAAWDYHLGAGSPAIDSTWAGPATDFDGQNRPASSSTNTAVDKGADEVVP